MDGSRTIAAKENCLSTLKLTLFLTQTLTLTGGQFSSGAMVRIPLWTTASVSLVQVVFISCYQILLNVFVPTNQKCFPFNLKGTFSIKFSRNTFDASILPMKIVFFYSMETKYILLAISFFVWQLFPLDALHNPVSGRC